MRKILLLHTIDQYKIFNSSKKKVNEEMLIIAFSLELIIFLKHKGIPFDVPEHYINDNEAIQIDKFSFNLAENWHDNLFRFKGVSLGHILEYEFKYFFSRIVKNIQTIIKIIDKEKPKEIIIVENNQSNIREFNRNLKYVCSLKNILLTTILIGKTENKEQIYCKKEIQNFSSQILLNFALFLQKMIIKIIYRFNRFRNTKIKRIKKNILIIGHDSYNFHKSVIEELSKSRNYNIMLSSTFPNFKKYIKHQFQKKDRFYYIIKENYFTNKILKQSTLFIKNEINKWKKIINDTKFKKQFCFNGFNFWEIIKEKILLTIIYDFKGLIEHILINRNLLIKEKIDLIIFNQNETKSKLLIAIIASKLNIHTLTIQHGVHGRIGNVIGYERMIIPSPIEKLAAWNISMKEYLIKLGLDQDKIILTGCPRFDKLIQINKNIKLKAIIKKSIYSNFKIKPNNRLIILTPPKSSNDIFSFSITPSEIEKIYSCVLNTIKKIPKSYLIIRLHPSDSNSLEQILNELIKKLNIKNASVSKRFSIEKMLIACDCLITSLSTTGLEALILNKPIICLNFNRRTKFLNPYTRYNAAIEVLKRNELTAAINEIFKNPNKFKENREQFIKDFNYNNDGLASKRVCNLVKDMLL